MPDLDPNLRRLVEELSEAEAQSLEDEGPVLTRFHRAVAALCEYVGIQNRWDRVVEEDRVAHPERYASTDDARDIPRR